MSKKTVAILLSAAMTMSLLAGCSKPDNKAEESVKEEESVKGEAEGEKEEGGKEEVEEVVLKWYDFNAYATDEEDAVIAKFEEEHPGVTVEIQHNSGESAILQSRINANDIPDVIMLENGTSADTYREYLYDWQNDTDVLDLFYDDAKYAFEKEDGSVIALPMKYSVAGLIYNVDCFKQAGITELPVTVDELEECCKKLKAAGITPFALDAKDAWALNQLATHFIIDKSTNTVVTNEALKNGELELANLPHWDNLFKFLDLAVEYGPDKPLEVDFEIAENKVATGEAAILSMGNWAQSAMDSFNADANLAFLPTPVGGTQEERTLLVRVSAGYAVHKDSENLELAKELAAYMLTSEDALKWFAEDYANAPAAISDIEIDSDLNKSAQEWINEGITSDWLHTIMDGATSDELGACLQAYMLGTMTKEEVTASVQNAWRAQ